MGVSFVLLDQFINRDIAMAWNKSTNTRHTCNSGDGPYFGRKTAGCPRCDELLAGSKPIAGWGDHKRMWEAQTLRAIQSHDCVKSNCGSVCTAFDW